MPSLKDFDHLLARPGKKIDLKDYKTDSTRHAPDRDKAHDLTTKAAGKLGEYQDLLYAEGRQSLLVILQGLDASGKDGTVRVVFDAVNPTGVQVHCFKTPTTEERAHDFLWRCHAKVPLRGNIGVFNRSYYEDVLIVRVHAERLLAPELRGNKDEWERRYRMIRDFELSLADSATRVVKFFLHVSKEEQRLRFVDRQKDPLKNWKLAAGDFTERQYWDDYQHAYEKMLPATSTKHAPWYIIPADRNWVRNYHIAHILAATLKEMNPQVPTVADPSLLTKRFK